LLYERVAQAFELIESTSGSLAKIDIFAELLKEADPEEISRLIALSVWKLYPDWMEQPEIGIAEKMAIQVIASAASVSESRVEDKLNETGDIGSAAEALLEGSVQTSLLAEELTINSVFQTLDATSKMSGQGSNRLKIAKLSGLLTDAKPIEAKYLLRTVTGRLRLGLGSMSILDALSTAFTGDRDARPELEHAFNVCSDLGRVAHVLATESIAAVKTIKARVGTPIRMMAAKKLSNATEILEKVGGEALVEYKYDGERVQVHKDGDEVVLFSRSQEKITAQYPDVVELVHKNIKAETCVIEGECVAVDPSTGKMRPFQELMRRRRKTDIESMSQEVPVALFFFDILFLNGEDVSSIPMLKRRKLLETIVTTGGRISLTTGEVTEDPDRLDAIFMEAINSGHEGVIAKAVHEKSGYQAGSRSWLWIKLKASYKEGISESVDLVIVGAIHGRGKRTGLYGAILASAYDEETDAFPTVCKIGTGFTDEMLEEFKSRLETHVSEQRNPKILSDVKADVWFEPVEVIEVLGDELTVSPTHLAGKDRMGGAGLAIRFPRFTGRWREDKSAKQATTVGELIETFERQRGS
jgi:DNA ligase-1